MKTLNFNEQFQLTLSIKTIEAEKIRAALVKLNIDYVVNLNPYDSTLTEFKIVFANGVKQLLFFSEYLKY